MPVFNYILSRMRPQDHDSLVGGAVEGATGLADLALQAGNYVYNKFTGSNNEPYQIGPKVNERLGLRPDRDSAFYTAGTIGGGALTGGAGAIRAGLRTGAGDAAAAYGRSLAAETAGYAGATAAGAAAEAAGMGDTGQMVASIAGGMAGGASVPMMRATNKGVLHQEKKGSKADQAAGLLSVTDKSTPEAIIEATEKGGYSINLPTGTPPADGLMMGKYSNTDPRNVVLNPDQSLDSATLSNFVKTNLNALSKDDNFLGTWRDPESRNIYLDVSRRFEPDEVRKATKFGERTGQLAGYDVGAGASFPVENWREFIQTPEFVGRMDQMAEVGRDYLNQHANKEWWDMHGSSFERVYGADRLDQLAGFIASTAPNAQPRENLQTMSEYMRRSIKGEPIIQPDWRVPPGQMSRREGSKIGMETGRTANLLKSQDRRLNELMQDKVREEAMALMGDPNAVVLDRHWARISEDPNRGVFAAVSEGVIEPGKDYQALKNEVVKAAKIAGRNPRDYSADVWTGIRETIKNQSELFGQKYKGSAIRGESKSYADQFDDLIADKAKFMGISVQEMERRLRNGDATLLSLLLATPLGIAAYQEYQSEKSGGI